ncbi:MAG: TonB-dependent receptor [Alphaproteobacteria bacterium]|nr:TonB-dependent receptor [Alphaproteobacteria bacterium]
MRHGALMATTMVGAFLFSFGAIAQTDNSATTSTAKQHKAGTVETIIVTGNKLQTDKVPMKAAFTESTISQETLLNESPGPTTTVQTLLNKEPSIYATTGGANGMETNIKFRSFADGEFGETIAGVPLNDVFNSGVTYQADNRNNVLFITRDLEGVQLYRGVNNPAVNTYNSLGGTINYLPRQPTDEMGGDVGVDGGSFGTIDYHATFNTGDWNGLKQTISVERDYSSSWLDNTPDWNDNLYYAGQYDVGKTQVYSYFVYNRNKGNAPQYIPVNLIRQNGWSYQWPTDTYRSANADTNFLGIIGVKSQLASFITFEDDAYAGDNNYQRESFSNPAYSGPYYLDDQGSGYPFWTNYGPPSLYDPRTVFASSKLGTDYHFYGYNGAVYGDRATLTADLPYNKVTAGGDFNVGELHSREYWYGTYKMPMTVGYNDAWDEHDTRQMWSVYVQDDIHFLDDRIHVTPGVKYIGSAAEDNDALGFFYVPPGSIHADEHFLSPTLGGSFEALTNFTLYASYGRNVKFPDITALYNELGYGGAVPPVTVKPEYAEDFEAGARYKVDDLQAAFNVYHENFSHIIYTAPVPGGYGATEQLNGGSQRYQGAELELTDDFGDVGVGNLKGYLNASYNEAICTSQSNPLSQGYADIGGSCSKGQSLANVPNYLFNAGLTWDWHAWHIDLQGHYVGRQQLLDYNTGTPIDPMVINAGQPIHIPDYLLVNLGIVKVVPINDGPANAVRLALHVDNIFNTHYYSDAQTNSNAMTLGEDVYANAGAPRAVYASVSVYF